MASRQFDADRAIVTLPLGVLQSGSVEFYPEPGDILQLARSARMGQVRRLDLLFRERFWTQQRSSGSQIQLDDLSFLFAFDEVPSAWWTQFPSCNGRITGWVGGPRSNALAEMTVAEVGKRACSALGRVFHLPVNEIETLLNCCYSHNWQRDPLSMGAYSYLPAGSVSVPNQMCDPIKETLYFAGEHTDTTGHWGTVHAALRSGLRAAAQILQS
ncbi:MAG TPA: FAD-dependent oxidoreductase [Acidobacteriaceae bacterium]|nr:FAD-dependent oxidoreductase [Acidobacteriaceae bacterium]